MPSANTIVSTYSIMPPIWVIWRGVLVFSQLTVKFTHKGEPNPAHFLLKTACLSESWL
jgi:hypothetical protein